MSGPAGVIDRWRPAACDAATLDNVVITGGSGAIGLRYAQYCIERGARRIILLSRNGIEAETLKELAGQHHVEVFAPECDITDRAAVATVAADCAGDGASLLIHAAGTAAVHLHTAAHRRRRGGGVRREGGGPGGDGRRLAAAAGMPNPGLLVGVRGVGRPRSRRLCGIQSAARYARRPAALEGAGLHRDPLGPVAGRRRRRGG